MQFTKPFQGVPHGQIYPVQYQPGEECPPELESAATELGAFGDLAADDVGASAPQPVAPPEPEPAANTPAEDANAGVDAAPSLAKPGRKSKAQ